MSTAASTDSPVATQQAFEALYNYLDIALKFLYIMLWPLLFIVGLAMDNALVLGQAFHLDAALFQFWQMATNLANFALGGLVMYQIFTLLVGQSDTKKVLNVFKNALFAGIGIQASWFIFISLLDLSTIATYAIGALPTSILGDMQSAEDSYVLNNNISFDFDQTSAEKMISNNYSCPAEPNKRLQECYIYD